MNRFYFTAIALAVFLAGGVAIQYYERQSAGPQEVTVSLKAVKGEWRWDTTDIKVNHGDKVKVVLENQDDIDHGLGLDGYGLSKAVAPGQTVVLEFTADRKGKFNFYCSVPCGQGEVGGETRGHFDMRGSLEVA